MIDDSLPPFLFDGEVFVNVVMIDSAPWFVAADVCLALGLINPSEVVRSLEEDEKRISSADRKRGSREVIVISESGLYMLIFKSRKEIAVRFRKWVTAEVLPSLRHGGTYTMPGFNPTRKPYPEWSNEDIRVALAEVNTAIKAMGRGAGAWTWKYVGLPVPPAHLLSAWWQADLMVHGPTPPG